MFPNILARLGWAIVILSAAFGDAQTVDLPKQGAALLKTDILDVFAHPDDETGIAATLADYAVGRTSVVANVYCKRGEGGRNMVGTQWGRHWAICGRRNCATVCGFLASASAAFWTDLIGRIPKAPQKTP